jgi:hypothetical protein
VTWAERFGDLATNVALVLINALRIVTLLVSIAADKLDDFITALAERSEGGISPASGTARGWLSLPASVAWGIAAIALRATSVVTVFIRQAAATVDGFLEALSEGPEPPQPTYTAPGTAA